MVDYEKLGVFYLGKEYDIASAQTEQELVLYDSKDLTTHAVIVGMTGSGKTGLGITLLEEAAIDGIPALIIDPKGDMGNLLLNFPQLRTEDVLPWIEPEEAARKGMSTTEYAAQTVQQWKQGLSDWQEPQARIQKLRDACEMAIYTPGSDAGIPLTVLKSLNAPPPAVLNNNDSLRERITSAVSGLLSLLDISGDPLRSREHILVSSILDKAWRAGQNVDMAGLIRQIQSPPFKTIGIMDLEAIFPVKDRMELAMTLNNVLASPGFSGWLRGEPLNIQSLMYSPSGKPKLSVISIAHLSDKERMFFLTILFNEVISWMRSQSGTSSLRAILYMDEMFGYLPPTANPPTKTPLLTLLKQARAFGVGLVLATQNPVDLDYKALSNAGSWFLGRLQTERDKLRVLDGLEGASSAAGVQFDRAGTERILSSLGNRVFLMNNVHEQHPVVFQSRWALSYLRGPLTRDQISLLMGKGQTTAKDVVADGPPPLPGASPTSFAPAVPPAPPMAEAVGLPNVPPDVRQVFQAARHTGQGQLTYRPALLGTGKLHYVDSSVELDVWLNTAKYALIGDEPPNDPWEESTNIDPKSLDLGKEPEAGIGFAPLAIELTRSKNYTAWVKSLKDYLYRTECLKLRAAADLDQYSDPGETEGQFRARLKHETREQRDGDVEKLRKKYGPKIDVLKEKERKAEQKVAQERTQASGATLQAAVKVGASLLEAFLGRKTFSATNIQRAASSARAVTKVSEEKGDVGRAQETLSTLQEQREALEQELQSEIDKLADSFDADALKLGDYEVKPRKSDVTVDAISLCWFPFVIGPDGIPQPAF